MVLTVDSRFKDYEAGFASSLCSFQVLFPHFASRFENCFVPKLASRCGFQVFVYRFRFQVLLPYFASRFNDCFPPGFASSFRFQVLLLGLGVASRFSFQVCFQSVVSKFLFQVLGQASWFRSQFLEYSSRLLPGVALASFQVLAFMFCVSRF